MPNMTSDELTKLLIELVNGQPPETLAAKIEELTPLSHAQALDLAATILTAKDVKREVDAIARRGGVVDVPSEIP